jgi:hypothetical protein
MRQLPAPFPEDFQRRLAWEKKRERFTQLKRKHYEKELAQLQEELVPAVYGTNPGDDKS